MKIGIDISSMESNPAGIGQYTAGLLTALLTIDKKNEYFLYSTKPVYHEANNIVIPRSKFLPFKGIRWMQKVARDTKRRGIDMFISPSNHLFALLLKNVATIIYDLSPIQYPTFFPRKGALVFKTGIRYFVPRSKFVFTISEVVKNDLAKLSKIPLEKIIVLYPSVNSSIKSKAINFVDFGLPNNYLLTISTLQPRKNILELLDGFKAYLNQYPESDLKLVIIGQKGWYYKDIFKKVDTLDLNDYVVFPGYVDDKYIQSVLKGAKAFIYLSKAEGFGMPILEALNYDLPTIASDIPVFRECFEDAVFFIDPSKPSDVVEAINEAVTEGFKPIFDKERYTWEKTANKLLKAIAS